MTKKEINDLSFKIIGAAIEVHKELGPGLLEHAYEIALMRELQLQGINAVNQVPLSLQYKGSQLNLAYRLDLLVEDEIIVELKATEGNTSVYSKQLMTYLKVTNKKLGLLINFNYEILKDGIKRIVNEL